MARTSSIAKEATRKKLPFVRSRRTDQENRMARTSSIAKEATKKKLPFVRSRRMDQEN